ncbi:MAG: hypothetical protein KJZ87_06225, partial [Thermoguttaceae bacterium]|nr:hypothetical protein [Thermoguttaceae bacterium]
MHDRITWPFPATFLAHHLALPLVLDMVICVNWTHNERLFGGFTPVLDAGGKDASLRPNSDP